MWGKSLGQMWFDVLRVQVHSISIIDFIKYGIICLLYGI